MTLKEQLAVARQAYWDAMTEFNRVVADPESTPRQRKAALKAAEVACDAYNHLCRQEREERGWTV